MSSPTRLVTDRGIRIDQDSDGQRCINTLISKAHVTPGWEQSVVEYLWAEDATNRILLKNI